MSTVTPQLHIDFACRRNMTAFINTINLKGDQLKEANASANAQAVKILSFFAQNPNEAFTPFEVADRFNAWPITSVRRAVTQLTDCNYLEKTKEMKPGKYGKSNYTWKFKKVA